MLMVELQVRQQLNGLHKIQILERQWLVPQHQLMVLLVMLEQHLQKMVIIQNICVRMEHELFHRMIIQPIQLMLVALLD